MTTLATGNLGSAGEAGDSLPAILARRACLSPDEACLHIVKFVNREPVAAPYSSRELFSFVERAAVVLTKQRVEAGDRVLLSLSNAADFLSFMVGAQCLGAIAVPAPSVSELPRKAFALRLAAIAKDAAPAVAVVDDDVARDAVEQECPGTDVLPLTSCFEGTLDATPDAFDPNRSPDDIAFLQYTSGSTGAPRGVVVRHRNLVANIRAILSGAAIARDDVIYSWLPLFHDMGLVAGLSLGLYAKLKTYLASPKTFISRPESWLRAITSFGVTFSAGPNFAFDILANRVPDRALDGIDLKTWRLAFNGAEPVQPRTMEAFTRRYARYGFRNTSFRPAYGLAECTLAVTFTRPDMPNCVDTVDSELMQRRATATSATASTRHSVTYTSVGVPIPEHRVHIVYPDGSERLPERHVGEIVVEGPSVTSGYFGQVENAEPDRKELRTGDLGYVANGELFVVGRLKDLVIVAGRKYAPSDIEQRVGALEGVRKNDVVAFAIGAAGTDAVCVAAALEPGAVSRRAAIIRDIHLTIMADFALTLADVILIRPGELPRTSSGKIMRSACAALYRTAGWGERSDTPATVSIS
ncbi:MAG TPA: AMP-binding protein [Polyangiaceae bacterium]|nr:AMP-binding protein [Polyangiaceae bacterium]